jgi:uncharacterized membrane-anchored protein
MKYIKPIVIVLNLIALLVYFHYSIHQKEEILQGGQLILLKLAPEDPRSLMQGDYMRLDYDINRGIEEQKLKIKRGFCVVRLDENGVAQLVRTQADKTPISENEYLIEFTYSDFSASIGAGSYFFEEGQAARFEKAEYGGVKVDKYGNSVLIGLYDGVFKKI